MLLHGVGLFVVNYNIIMMLTLKRVLEKQKQHCIRKSANHSLD